MSRWPIRHGTLTLTRLAGTAQRTWPAIPSITRPPWNPSRPCRALSCGRALRREAADPRIQDLGREISDDYAALRDHYATPKHPIVLAHGLLGFSELKLGGGVLPAVEYWHGIKTALTAQGATVITTTVPPTASIEERAAALAADIAAKAPLGAPVNIIAHSMGGLDARHMIAHLPDLAPVASLVTVATPHRGSALADHLLEESVAGPLYLPRLYGALSRAGLGTAAFDQLTRRYMAEVFNPATRDRAGVRYFSYGAAMAGAPGLLSPFRRAHAIVEAAEGANDGLVSVASARWGAYCGTLVGVSHLDLINWSNRVGWTVREWMGMRRTFNAVAFYLGISDMLAKEGL